MKRAGLQNSKRVLAALALFVGLLVSIPVQSAQAVNDVSAACVIGSDSACPAQSPQEISNLYGTTANGTYWLNVNGTATQTYLVLDTSYPDGGMWFLGMKGTKAGTSFSYAANYWTSQSTTLVPDYNNDVASEAKYNAFNYLPVTQIVAVFKDRNSYNFSSSGTGSLGASSFGGHTWKETISSQTMYSRFSTAGELGKGSGTMPRYEYYRESNSASANLVFAYQSGYYKYGFAYDNNGSNNSAYRWGAVFNNEQVEGNLDSSDAQMGIGLRSYSAASVYTYVDQWGNAINGGTGQNGNGRAQTDAATYPSGFQIWGKMATPSMAAPTSLTKTTVGNGSVQLNIGAASGASEYAVQYKLSANAWSSATTVRVTNPSASPIATLTGLASGTYDFRVWTRGTNDSSNTSISLTSQIIDSTAPTITDTTYSTTSGGDSVYGKGDSFTVRMTFSETVTVTGSPRIPIQGLSSKYFTYYSGSGTKVLDFNYVIAEGDLDTDGVAVTSNSLALNGGAIKDLALNDATLNHIGLSAASFFAVDGVTPTVSSVTTSSNGQSAVITLSEIQSSTLPTTSALVITVGGIRDTVTAVSRSGSVVTLTLTFGVIAGDTVQLTYTDPTTANDVNALQDVAGNDVATFSISVTNASTSSSNTSAVMALNPASSTAVYRAVTSIQVTTNTAGRVDFFQAGKIIVNCRNVATSGNIASCSWKPMVHAYITLTARFRPSGNGYQVTNTSPLQLFVVGRSGNR
jgi:hypothetical protein